MKDIIWTLIIVWFVYKLVDVFKSATKKNLNNQTSAQTVEMPKQENNRDIKSAVQKHLNKEGEYVDFEEIK